MFAYLRVFKYVLFKRFGVNTKKMETVNLKRNSARIPATIKWQVQWQRYPIQHNNEQNGFSTVLVSPKTNQQQIYHM